MQITPTEAAILSAIISSSVLAIAIEYLGDKVLARFKYNGWQAVKLANSETYYGKVTSVTRNDIRLSDIYYLQTQGKKLSTPGESYDEDTVSLIKQGEELHGPKDFMTIGRAHIVYIQTLKDTAQVVRAIEVYQTGNLNT